MLQTLLAQISDTHIREPGRMAYGRLDTSVYLQQAVKAMLALPQRPDALVMTGDLTDFGRAQEYAHLRALLQPLDMPVYLLPGNHDSREEMRAAFPEYAYLGTGGFVQYSVAVGPMQLIALDTVTPNASHGELCADRLDWLSRELDKHANKPVVVAMHHPPFPTLIGHMDKIGLLAGAQELERIMLCHPNVQRVICGHMHRAIQTRFGHALAMSVPSPAHQVCLDLDANAASAWNLEPAAFALHALAQSGQVISHLAYTGSYEGPYPFHEPGGQLID